MRYIKRKWLFLLGVCVLILSSCRSSKQVATTTDDLKAKEVMWTQKVTSAVVNTGTVTSKMNIELFVDGKRISVGGNCNLKRDEAIQLSVSLLGFMEVGRLELTPDYLLLINRAERQYVKVNYSEIPYLRQVGIDFYSLQALFWSDLFVLGKGNKWSESDFAVTRAGGKVVLQSATNSLLQCSFLVNVLSGLIENSSVTVSGKTRPTGLIWNYEHFVALGDRQFPDKMKLGILDSGKETSATISLSNVKWNAKDVELTKEPGSKYRKVDASSLLNKLIKL